MRLTASLPSTRHQAEADLQRNARPMIMQTGRSATADPSVRLTAPSVEFSTGNHADIRLPRLDAAKDLVEIGVTREALGQSMAEMCETRPARKTSPEDPR
jgi:hypothetical protein